MVNVIKWSKPSRMPGRDYEKKQAIACEIKPKKHRIITSPHGIEKKHKSDAQV
jgi:hypothetical protein